MKLLYVGQLGKGGTCYARSLALEKFGCEIIPFDILPFVTSGSWLEQSILSRTNIGRAVTRLNHALVKFAEGVEFDAVWIDKGLLIRPETLSSLRKRAQFNFATHYTPDPQIVLHRAKNFFESVPIYDLLATTKTYEVELYREFGARNLILVLQGYGPQFHSRLAGAAGSFESDVCFVGHCERHYAGRIRAAVGASSSLAVWGPSWPRYARHHEWAKGVVRGEGVWGADYPKALASTRIALGLLSKLTPDTNTTRSFEIPATGVFMLAERNEDHQSLFEEGKEAEFFGDDEELRDKIRFYLANDEPRRKIAAAGRERCLKSGYSDLEQLARVLNAMVQLISAQRTISLSLPGLDRLSSQ